MKKWVLVVLLLSIAVPAAFSDNLVHCPAAHPDCGVTDTSSAMHANSEADKPTNEIQPNVSSNDLPIQSKFVLPQLEEFYVPLQTYSTVLGAAFGSLKKQNRQIEQYWADRRTQLEAANNRCISLIGDDNIRDCLNNVRQTEIRKSQIAANQNQQYVQQQYTRAMYAQQAFRQQMMMNQINNQFNQLNRPRNTNCYGYGSTLNCTTY